MSPNDIAALFAERGHLSYEGEGITQLQHGWQCASLARQAAVTPALQLAARLHDLGHLMTGLDGSPTTRGIDDSHEALAASALAGAFGTAVAEPVALHVRAKRCLATRQPRCVECLSPDSVRSLALQGGPMTEQEAVQFLTEPHANDALRLRSWDDRAKVADLHPESPAHALAELQVLMQTVLEARRS